MIKKVFKIIGFVALCLLLPFMILMGCYKNYTPAIKLNAASPGQNYNLNYVVLNFDVDDDSQDKLFLAPNQFYNGSSNVFSGQDAQTISKLFIYDDANNSFYVDFVIKQAYENSYGLYIENDNLSRFICYYSIVQNGGVYQYVPHTQLLNNYGGIVSIPNNYQYDIVDLSNTYNFTHSTILTDNSFAYIDTNCNNYVMIPDYNFVNYGNISNVYYNNGFDNGVQNVIDNPNNYGLYDQAQYDAYGQTQFSLGSESDLTSNWFRVMLSSIFNAPYQILQPVLNFEIFGVNLWNLFTFVISCLLVMFLIKIIRGARNG